MIFKFLVKNMRISVDHTRIWMDDIRVFAKKMRISVENMRIWVHSYYEDICRKYKNIGSRFVDMGS